MIRRWVLAMGVFLAADAAVWGQSTYTYVTWTTATASGSTPGAPGSASGVITIGSQTVSVTYSGDVAPVNNYPSLTQVGSGATFDYWSPATTFTNATVLNPPANDSLIGLDEMPGFINTITFSTPVVNPILDILSLGNAGTAITYTFSSTPVLLNQGPQSNFGTCSNAPCLVLSGNSLTGMEGDGVIEFVGTVSSISWTTTGTSDENGFTVGVLSVPGGPAPTITSLLNNYSYTLPGLPNYGIAQGSIFVIFGTNLNSQPPSGLLSSASPGLQTTVNGTSISVTVNGVTTQPFIYYTSAAQVNAVLPSNTPVGPGIITVTSNGQPSAGMAIQVVQSAFGILTQNQEGTGQAIAQDPNNDYSNFSFTNSAKPGQLIGLWGSGVGPDTANNDYLFPQNKDNLTSIPMQIYIGGISANITYRGRSQYPGLDQILVTVPANVTPGCAVSLVISSGSPSLTSNSVSIPVAQSGGACSDSFSPFTGTLLQSLSGKSTVNVSVLKVGQVTAPSTTGGTPATTSSASAVFNRYSQVQFDDIQAEFPSIGSCVIIPPTTATPTGLDAGSVITLTGPSGQVLLTTGLATVGSYAPGSPLASTFFPSTGGTFTFTGTGGADVGAFTVSTSIASPFVWTNAASLSTVNRANGFIVTWTGGGSNSYVIISGSSSASVSFQATPVTVQFVCIAAVGPGQFTVPSAITQSLPPAQDTGTSPPTLSVENAANPALFSTSGVDLGYATSFVSDLINVTYQ